MKAGGILLTGFEPFGGETLNPSWLVAQALHGQRLGAGGRGQGRLTVHALCLPCEFGRALAVLQTALQQLQPSLVLALGQAGGRAELTPERVAINVNDARIPDNQGQQPIDTPVVPGAPAAYFSTLPIKAMVAAIRGAGLPAAVSQTAGTFVCNHVFYGLMHSLQASSAQAAGPGVRGGFMHLPWLPEQAALHRGQPSLALAQQVEGVRLALQAALRSRQDLQQVGGALD